MRILIIALWVLFAVAASAQEIALYAGGNFSGKIDNKHDIYLQIGHFKSDHQLSGYYLYTNVRGSQTMELSGKLLNVSTGELVLERHKDDPNGRQWVAERFEGKIAPDFSKLEGKWTKFNRDGSIEKSHPFAIQNVSKFGKDTHFQNFVNYYLDSQGFVGLGWSGKFQQKALFGQPSVAFADARDADDVQFWSGCDLGLIWQYDSDIHSDDLALALMRIPAAMPTVLTAYRMSGVESIPNGGDDDERTVTEIWHQNFEVWQWQKNKWTDISAQALEALPKDFATKDPSAYWSGADQLLILTSGSYRWNGQKFVKI